MNDTIDRQALLKQIDIDSDGEPGYYGDTWKFIDTIKNMPNVHDLLKDTDTISKQAAIKILHEAFDAADQIADVPFGVYQNYRDKMNELPPAQLAPDQNGDVWITVPDIDKVTCIYVQESKSKFCRIFYEEQEQPERIRGRWIHKSQVPDIVRGYWATCSSCGRGSFGGGNFCRECGSDNRKEKEK